MFLDIKRPFLNTKLCSVYSNCQIVVSKVFFFIENLIHIFFLNIIRSLKTKTDNDLRISSLLRLNHTFYINNISLYIANTLQLMQ